MSFTTALSGMNAASANLGVTANNIANASTVGFKESRAEFGDLYPVSTYGLSRNTIGVGVRLSNVAQQFSQGNVEFSGRALDIAISGSGFFTLSDRGANVYSRAGNFAADREGYVVNPAGQRLQVYPPNPTGTGFQTGTLSDLRLNSNDAPPRATNTVFVGTNLPANATVPVVAPFDPADPQSYNHTTSLTVYDSLGSAHSASLYYVATGNPNEWAVHTQIDGVAAGGANLVQYSTGGLMTSPASGQIALPAVNPGTGAAPMNITLDVTGSTQYGDRFAVAELRQDGNTTGRLTGIEVSPEGVVFSRYTNGDATPLGQIAMTTFTNPQGLQPLGNTAWGESFDSGQPRRGEAGSSDFGVLQSGALEASNVDLTAQLVNMITAQRNFQANAQMISTDDQITQTVINIR